MNSKEIENSNLLKKKKIQVGSNCKIKAKKIEIEENVIIEDDVELIAKRIVIRKNSIIKQKTRIHSQDIEIGYNSTIAKKCKINVLENFCIGDRSDLCECDISGRNITIGNDFFSSNEPNSILIIGGGGCFLPTSSLSIGNRCTVHNAYINIANSIKIGNDVGISPFTKLYTHYFWKSIFECYPQKFEGINIGDECIIGAASIFLPGTALEMNCMVGAGSIITKKFPKNSIIGGNPAKVIREFTKKNMNEREKEEILRSSLEWYFEILSTKGATIVSSSNQLSYIVELEDKKIEIGYDSEFKKTNIDSRRIILTFKQLKPKTKETIINLNKKTISGFEDEFTDDLRDFLRKIGIRIFTERKFRSFKNAKNF